MENIRIIRILLYGLAILLSSAPVRAYSPTTTHHGLTSEIIKFFEYSFPISEFTAEEIEWIKDGSVDEDHDIRPMNHFYDPVTGKGLWGFISSKDWVNNTLAQANRSKRYLSGTGNFSQPLFSSLTDYSWDRAVYEYVYGDRKRAFQTLGHVLHLLEDATVPDHTRNDPHPPYADEVFGQASPYEGWTSKFTAVNMKIADELIVEKSEPLILSSLDEYFHTTALFSNQNFFSKDSIFSYDLPRLDPTNTSTEVDQFIYGKFGHRLIREKRSFDIKKNSITKTFDIEDKDNLIMRDYWEILSRQAVINGAGVVKLFFDEVEKEKETSYLFNKNKSWFSIKLEKFKFSIANLFDSKSNTASVASVSQTDNVTVPDLIEEDVLLVPDSSGRENYVSIPQLKSDYVKTAGDYEISELVKESKNDVFKAVISGETSREDIPKDEGVPVDKEPEPEAILTSPTILDPDDFNHVFTTKNVTFRGQSVLGSRVKTNLGVESEVDSDGQWEVELTFEEGTTTIDFWAFNSEIQSDVVSRTIYVDTIGPGITLNIQECEDSITEDTCLFTEDVDLNIYWFSPGSNSYEVDMNGEKTVTTSTSTIGHVSEGNSLEISVTAYDSFGNSSITRAEAFVYKSPIVISEIAWAGTSASPDHEWIELYNRTDYDIDLTEWYLKSTIPPPDLVLEGKIRAKSYYLMERASDDVVADVKADIIYPNAALNNEGEELILMHASTTIDKTPSRGGGGCIKWCAGYNRTSPTVGRYSMERIDSNSPGNDISNWATTLGEYVMNGVDASGQNIYGTPGRKNSVSYLISSTGRLSNDKVLQKEESPYLITRVGLEIPAGVYLSVPAGVVIKIVPESGPLVNVYGTLIYDGTASDPVVITSIYDDDFGGNIDGLICDQETRSNCPDANWRRFVIEDDGSFSAKNTIFRFGGSWANNHPLYSRAIVYVDGGNVSMENVEIESAQKFGISLMNGSVGNIKSVEINNVNSDVDSVAIISGGSYLTLESPRFNNNTLDIELLGADDLPNFTCINCGADFKTIPVDLLLPKPVENI